MTPVHKVSADFKELKAFEVICVNCGAVFSIPIADHLGEKANCLGCNRRLWDGGEDRSYQRARGLMIMLHQWKEQEDLLFRLGFSLNMSTHIGSDI
jgi:uncharacterized paraquat-inducible protein A